MFETAISETALPNVHAALVHFPIALAVTALVVDAISKVFKKRQWLGSCAVLLYAFASIAGIASYLSGKRAADSVGQLSAQAEVVLAKHADLALLTVVILTAAAILRVAGGLLNPAQKMVKVTTTLAFLVMLAANILVAITADRGGALVYRHAVAVEIRPQVANDGEQIIHDFPQNVSRHQGFETGNDGSLRWTPAGGDPNAITDVLRPADGASIEAVSVVGSGTAGGDGLAFSVSGSTVVCFPGVFDDVVITATVDIADFEGVFGLGHHIQSVDQGVFFTLSSKGDAELVRRADGEIDTMNQGAISIPPGLLTMRTSVAGRHLKGQVGEATVVHGHGSSGEEGAVGLFLDGRGVVVITQVSVDPARTN